MMLPTILECSFYGYSNPPDKSSIIIYGTPFYRDTYGAKPVVNPTYMLRLYSRLVEDNFMEGKGYYSQINASDIGDLTSMNLKDIEIDIETIMRYTTKKRRKFVMIGGSHLYTYYTVKSIKPSALIILDAHLDMKTKLQGSELNHATYLRKVAEEEITKEIHIIGYRAYEKEEIKYANKKGIHLWRAEEEFISNTRGFKRRRVYISIDLDHLDPSYMPHVSNPEPNGLTMGNTLNLLSYLRRERVDIIGGDVMEYTPTSLDPHPGVLASRIVLELLRTETERKL
jgi:arginase family enzyme